MTAKTKPVLAWRFIAGDKLRDDTAAPHDGEWLEYTGKIEMCHSGLHASRDPFDALQYAPGETLCLVECDGIADEQPDKLVCRRRKIIARMDATELLRYFARMQALSAFDYWDVPDVVADYVMTGDESIRDAALDAAWDAARKFFNQLVNECFGDFLEGKNA